MAHVAQVALELFAHVAPSLRGLHKDTRVVMAGHSLGGSLAKLLWALSLLHRHRCGSHVFITGQITESVCGSVDTHVSTVSHRHTPVVPPSYPPLNYPALHARPPELMSYPPLMHARPPELLSCHSFGSPPVLAHNKGGGSDRCGPCLRGVRGGPEGGGSDT